MWCYWVPRFEDMHAFSFRWKICRYLLFGKQTKTSNHLPLIVVSHFSAEESLEAGQDEEGPPVSRDSESERRVATPTATESQLPWKRNDNGDEDDGPIKQNEFPAWVSNKEYLAYNSPSATFLGKCAWSVMQQLLISFLRKSQRFWFISYFSELFSSFPTNILEIEFLEISGTWTNWLD